MENEDTAIRICYLDSKGEVTDYETGYFTQHEASEYVRAAFALGYFVFGNGRGGLCFVPTSRVVTVETFSGEW